MFFLNEGIYSCELDGIHIFLDARTNRYFSFADDQAKWFSEIQLANDSTALSGKAAVFARRLLDKDILTTDSATGKPIEGCASSPPLTSVLEESPKNCEDTQLKDLPTFIYALATSEIVWKWKGNSIYHLLAAAKRWKKKAALTAPPSVEQVLAKVSRFHELTPFFITTRDACLFRSLFLIRYLGLLNIESRLVFGVQTSPFSAHCWVEHERIVLNDYRDNTLGYSPILSA